MNHFNRNAAVTLLISCLNFALFALYVGLNVTGSSDGTRLLPTEPVWTREGVIVTALENRPGGLQTGDIVLAVNGRGLVSWVEQAMNCPFGVCAEFERADWAQGQEPVYTISRAGQQFDLPIRLAGYPLLAVLRSSWGGLIFATVTFLIVAVVFYLRPTEPAVRVLLISVSSLLGSMAWAFGLQVGDLVTGTGFWLHRLATEGVYLVTWAAGLHFILIFPRPHPLVQRHRWIIPTIYLLAFAAYGVYLLISQYNSANALEWMGSMPIGQSAIVLAYLLASLAAVITNYRAQYDTVSRQQMRIFILALTVVLVVAVTLWMLPQVVIGDTVFNSHAMGVVGLIVPVALAVSILRYRLWDVDIIINRTLVYALLTAIVVSIYVVIVGVVGAYLQTGGIRLPVSLLATGIVAVLFQPIRARLQRWANRLMFGERDEPYTVLKRLSDRLEDVMVSEQVLPIIVETVAQAFKLPYAAITLKHGRGGFRVAAEYSATPIERPDFGSMAVVPLVYHLEMIGQLVLTPGGRGETLSQADWQLLETIAQQASVAAYNVRLTQDLQRSRERLVTMREEERRRLRRDLHDGLGPVLASMSFKLDAVYNLADTNSETVRELATQIKSQIQTSLAEVRRIAYNLRPPALDELGLVGALKEHIALYNQSNALQITLDMPETLSPLSAAVEVAAYRIVLEAITNVQRHAQARRCQVHIAREPGEGWLFLEIRDNGQGMPAEVRGGVGLNAMRERAEELGGRCTIETLPGMGTTVTAQLPLSKDHYIETESNRWKQYEF